MVGEREGGRERGREGREGEGEGGSEGGRECLGERERDRERERERERERGGGERENCWMDPWTRENVWVGERLGQRLRERGLLVDGERMIGRERE